MREVGRSVGRGAGELLGRFDLINEGLERGSSQSPWLCLRRTECLFYISHKLPPLPSPPFPPSFKKEEEKKVVKMIRDLLLSEEKRSRIYFGSAAFNGLSTSGRIIDLLYGKGACP